MRDVKRILTNKYRLNILNVFQGSASLSFGLGVRVESRHGLGF